MSSRRCLSTVPALLFLVIGGIGCASKQAAPAATVAPVAHTSGPMCPTQVAGTQVVATDTEDGASLAFTTTGDVAEVRARVRRMADHHNQMHGAGGRGGMGGRGMNMPMVPSRASVQDIDGGARIVFTPLDAANLEALRAEARRHAGMMASGECPMRMMGATPPPRAPQ